MTVLDRVIEERRREREYLRLNTLQICKEALKSLSERIEFEFAYIFGSIVKPYRFTEFSDVDIAIQGLDSSNFLYAASFLSDFIGFEVDLVEFEKLKFKNKILSEGILWKRD